MIKFFRKIRYKLLSENKTAKYFKYAIGEIFLVVIGILIALFLNNLNQKNTIHKQQENYLRLIKQEMISNINSLAVEKGELSGVLKGTWKILNICNSNALIENLSEEDLSKTMALTIRSDIFIQYENGALNQIIFSGGLKDIENDSIRGILASWEGKTKSVRLQEEQVNDIIEKIKNLLSKYGDTRSLIDEVGYSEILELDETNIKGSNKNLLKLKEFENVFFELILSGKALQQISYTNFENEMQSLIDLINQELSEK